MKKPTAEVKKPEVKKPEPKEPEKKPEVKKPEPKVKQPQDDKPKAIAKGPVKLIGKVAKKTKEDSEEPVVNAQAEQEALLAAEAKMEAQMIEI